MVNTNFPVNKLKTYTETQLADKQKNHSDFLIIKEINHKTKIMYYFGPI